MKFIEDMDIDNKKVILRLDLNVTIKDGVILDNTKIKKSIKTINYILSKNAKVLIMSHLGKIKNEEDKKNNSLKIVSDELSKLINKDVYFINNTNSKELENALNDHDLCLMENTRFEDVPLKRESGCDLELSKYWASLGDVFINDAFGTTHRKHASNYGISKYLESGYGYLIKEELVGVSPVVIVKDKPFVVIMGGAKVDDKVALIKSMLSECDYLLVGGGIANTFLKASGYSIGKSLFSEEYVDEVKNIINEYKDKILIPSDVVLSDKENAFTKNINEINDNESIYDIGPKTIESYSNILKNAKTIFVNGTVGLYENDLYSKGTISLYECLKKIDAKKIAGGGDAVASINKLGYSSSFDFLSTGGGATLEYITKKHLACFEGE